VIFYGHGALIRRDVWEKAGGFPEIVSEDLAFSTRIRQMGYRGYFAHDVICYEDFPETYLQFRRRQEKWVQGACEYLHREFLPFLFARGVTFAEKMDVLLSLFVLFIPALFLLYLFVANAFLPVLLAEKHILSMTILGKTFNLMPAYFLEPTFKQLWTLDLYLMTILGMFSPVLCYLTKVFFQPRKIGRLLLKSAVPYISLILVASCGILRYLFTRKAIFLATGDRTSGFRNPGHGTASPRIRQIHANHPLVFHCEWILGLILTYLSLMTMNIALLTISTCLILSPIVARFGWEQKAVSFLVFLPLLFVFLTFSGIGLGFLGIQGFSLYFLAFHF
jgi:membrane glycosyltransferase